MELDNISIKNKLQMNEADIDRLRKTVAIKQNAVDEIAERLKNVGEEYENQIQVKLDQQSIYIQE